VRLSLFFEVRSVYIPTEYIVLHRDICKKRNTFRSRAFDWLNGGMGYHLISDVVHTYIQEGIFLRILQKDTTVQYSMPSKGKLSGKLHILVRPKLLQHFLPQSR